MATIRLLMIAPILLLSGGCLTIGPRTETRFVVVLPGDPVQVVTDAKLPVIAQLRSSDGTTQTVEGRMSLAGKIAVDPDVFMALQRDARAYRESRVIDRIE